MGFEDEAYGDPFSGLSSSDVGGPTTPAEGQGIGGNFFGGLLDLARQFVPGVNSALNLAGKVGNFIGTISGTRPAPDVSSFGGSDYSAYNGRDIPPPNQSLRDLGWCQIHSIQRSNLTFSQGRKLA